MVRRARVLGTVGALIASSVAAQVTIPVTPEFADYLKGRFERDAIAAAIRAQVSQWPSGCNKDVELRPRVGVSIQEPIQIVRDGPAIKSLSGVWTESQDATVCGVTRQHNILNIARGTKIVRLPKLVGTSITDFVLQRDASKNVVIAARTFLPANCKIFATDTKFLGREGEPIANAKIGPTARVWREEWTIRGCGYDVILPIVFTPTATGTDFRIALKDVRKLESPPSSDGQRL